MTRENHKRVGSTYVIKIYVPLYVNNQFNFFQLMTDKFIIILMYVSNSRAHRGRNGANRKHKYWCVVVLGLRPFSMPLEEFLRGSGFFFCLLSLGLELISLFNSYKRKSIQATKFAQWKAGCTEDTRITCVKTKLHVYM